MVVNDFINEVPFDHVISIIGPHGETSGNRQALFDDMNDPYGFLIGDGIGNMEIQSVSCQDNRIVLYV